MIKIITTMDGSEEGFKFAVEKHQEGDVSSIEDAVAGAFMTHTAAFVKEMSEAAGAPPDEVIVRCTE